MRPRHFLILFLLCARAFSLDPAQFSAWYQAQSQPNAVFPSEAATRAKELKWVFVKGFLNEVMRVGYFSAQVSELKRLGVPSGQIRTLAPSSFQSNDANAENLFRDIETFAGDSGHKVVLVGHSRGAASLLAVLLEHAEFTRRRVEAVFLIQGAFGGSAIADYFQGEGPEPDSRIPSAYRNQFCAITTVGGALAGCLGLDTAIAEMTHRKSAERWKELLERHSLGLTELGKKVFYITGRKEPAKAAPMIRANAHYIHYSCGDKPDSKGNLICPNDGMLAEKDQILPGFGTPLASLRADHLDLIKPFPFSLEPASYRTRFSRALILSAAQIVAENEPTTCPGRLVYEGSRR